MSITPERLRAALEALLPQDANYKQSADLGDKDLAGVSARVREILLTALTLDSDATYYLSYLAAQRALAALANVQVALSVLMGEGGVLGLSGVPALPPVDVAGLEGAQRSLVRLSTGVASTGRADPTEFAALLEAFLSEQLTPRVLSPDREASSTRVRGAAESLERSWHIAREEVSRVQSVVPDALGQPLTREALQPLLMRVSRVVQEALEALRGSPEFAVSEDTLVALVASEAALVRMSTSTQTTSEVLQGPFPTGPKLLASETYAGDAGRWQAQGDIFEAQASVQRGVLVASTTGVFAPGFVSDPSVPSFTAAGVTAGHWLLHLDTGDLVRVTGALGSFLYTSPALQNSPTAKYVILAYAPGSRFQSPEIFTSRGTLTFEQDTLASGSIVTPTDEILLSAFNGSYRLDHGSGVLNQSLETGSAGTHSSDVFTDLSALLLTSGVSPGDLLEVLTGPNTGVYTVLEVLGETTMRVVSPFPSASSGSSWRITPQDADSTLNVPAGRFTSTGVQVGDSVRINGATVYLITHILSPFKIRLAGSFPPDQNVNWEVRQGGLNHMATSSPTGNVSPGSLLSVGGILTRITAVTETGFLVEDPLPDTWAINRSFVVIEDQQGAVRRVRLVGSPNLVSLGVKPSMPRPEFRGGTPATVERRVFARLGDAYHPLSVVLSGDTIGILPAYEGLATLVGNQLTLPQATGAVAARHLIRFPDLRITCAVSAVAGNVLTLTAPPTSGEYLVELVLARASAAAVPWSLVAGRATRKAVSSSSVASSLVGSRILVGEEPCRLESRESSTEVYTNVEFPQGAVATWESVAFASGDLIQISGSSANVRSVSTSGVVTVEPPLGTFLPPTVTLHARPALALAGLVDWVSPEDAAVLGPEGFPLAWAGRYLKSGGASRRTLAVLDLDGDGVREALRVANPPQQLLSLAPGPYEVATQATRAGEALALTGVSLDQRIHLWGSAAVYEVDELVAGGAKVSPPTSDSALPGPYLVTNAEASASFGQYHLLMYLLEASPLEQDTARLRTRLAEALLDAGEVSIPVTSGLMATQNNGSWTLAGGDSGALAPYQRLTVGGKRAYISGVAGNVVTLLTPLPSSVSGMAWSTAETSISACLAVAAEMRLQVDTVTSVLEAYVLPTSAVVDQTLVALEEQGLDKAAALLLQGDTSEILSLGSEGASYVSAARSAAQQAGRAAAPSRAAARNDSTLASTTQEGTYNAARRRTVPEVDVRVALSAAVRDLTDAETTRSFRAATVDEMRNRAVYRLTGSVVSSAIEDTDPTLPWIAKAGSVRDRLLQRYERAIAALDYMLEHPDEFGDP